MVGGLEVGVAFGSCVGSKGDVVELVVEVIETLGADGRCELDCGNGPRMLDWWKVGKGPRMLDFILVTGICRHKSIGAVLRMAEA